MKKIIFVLVCFSVLFMFASCASMKIIYREPVVEKFVEGEDVVDITLTPYLENGNAWYGTDDGTAGYSLTVKNRTDSIIKIVWEKSAVYYNSKSFVPFITGQKYINAGIPMSSTIVPVHGETKTEVYSAGQVIWTYANTWRMNNIPTYNTQVIICIESSTGETYYTFTVSEK